MTKPQYGWQHQKERQAALSMLRPGARCPLCGEPMDIRHPELLDFHHVKPVREGGINGPKVFTHRRCNRQDNLHVGEVRKIKGHGSHETSGKAAYKVLVKGRALHDIATCSHDFRKCEHKDSAIWAGCTECDRYSLAITMHAPCLEVSAAWEYYTDEGLPAWCWEEPVPER
jgi:hypothetical protein